jgi:hypothetical protein
MNATKRKPSTKESAIEKMIRLGFEGGILFFRVSAYQGDERPQLVRAISRMPRDWEKFEPVAVAGFVRRLIFNDLARMVTFGREYSPVLYIEPASGVHSDVIVELAGKWNLAHDEMSITPEKTVRIWWD